MKISKLEFNNKISRYNILIGFRAIDDLRKQIRLICPYTRKVALIFDKKIPVKLKNKINKQVKSYEVFKYHFQASEKLKSFHKINFLSEDLLKKNFNRDDLIISIGGGVISDFAGFAASIIKRGVNFINIPTTLLAQVDASFGGKTGINSSLGKNLIGSFSQPKLVISDTEFLKTLPRRELVCGFAEILKHSLVDNKNLFSWIEKNTSKILDNRDSKIIKYAIIKSCKIKIKFVEKDEKEKGDRAMLNFGHTFAHGIEAANNFSKKISHGEAVLIGMLFATKLSRKKNICSSNTLKKIIKFYEDNNLPRNLKKYSLNNSINKIVEHMKNDKKNRDAKINLILLKKIGKTTKLDQVKMTPKQIKSFLKEIT
tara:strand:+ start:5116 stop:6225 length:1110 start_codon:yes stop_codon:yes gene_type:complete